jgi:UDP:flavonoid glycosyltransferase YjiC (YdhE family)
LVQAQLTAADAFKPDFLFTEVDPAAFLVSRIRGIPIACTYASVLETGIGDFAWRAMEKSAGRVLQDFGRQPGDLREMLFGGDVLKLIASIPELEREIPAAPDYVFTGNLLHSFRVESEQAFRPEEGRRYVFVYMGTASVRLSAMRRVLPRVFPGGPSETAHCLVGSQSMTEELRIGNVVFRPFWDAESLMPHCEWVFCHGGHNTVIQSLKHGAPLLIFPGPIFERRFNAERVQAAGAGRFGETPEFNPHWIAEAMGARDACAANAARLGEKIRALGGARRAVEAMEGWVK